MVLTEAKRLAALGDYLYNLARTIDEEQEEVLRTFLDGYFEVKSKFDLIRNFPKQGIDLVEMLFDRTLGSVNKVVKEAIQEERYLQELMEHYIEIDALEERVDSPRTRMPTTGAIDIIRAAERDSAEPDSGADE